MNLRKGLPSRRALATAATGALALGCLLVLWQCGGSVCGNGVVEKGETCDNGAANGTQGNNCSASCTAVPIQRAQLQILYRRLVEPTDGISTGTYPAPTCLELGIDQAHFVLEGPEPKDLMVPCAMQDNQIFDPIMPGTYKLTVTLIDKSGQPLTKPKSSMMTDVMISDVRTDMSVEFTAADYLRQDYTGTFYFNLGWGSATAKCLPSGPAIETLKMVHAGSTTPQTQKTMQNVALDGTGGSSCFDTGQQVNGLPWGRYDFTVTGVTATTTKFCGKYSVFLGPGVATPTFTFAVPDVTMADGGACP